MTNSPTASGQDNARKTTWEAPRFEKMSLRETRATNGDDEDEGLGGIFLFLDPVRPPKRNWKLISADDKTQALEYIRAISSSPEKLQHAMAKPADSMTEFELSESQKEVVKGIFLLLGG